MKLRIFFPVFFLLCIHFGYSQDLIVTTKGDSLNCKIIYIESDFIHFKFKHENETRVTLMPVNEVKSYQKYFYSKSEVEPDKLTNKNYQKLRLAIQGGWSYETAKVSEDVPASLRDYVKDLKSGYHFGGDATFFISESVGFGVKYSMFRTKNQVEIYAQDTVTGQIRTGMLSDDITLQYIAPAVTARISSKDNNTHFYSSFALGYLDYKDNASIIDNFTLTGNTIGLLLDFGFDFVFTKDIGVGVGISYMVGSLKEFEYDDGQQKRKIEYEDGTAEGLNRLDISIGLRWYK